MKIYIFWASWSWKSTLWELISKKFGYKFIDLDNLLFWVDDISERENIINNLLIDLKGKDVVFDWIFRQDWLNNILKESDLIIVLQIPLWRIKLRLFLRTLKRMMWIEKSKFKSNLSTYIELLKFTDRYKIENREEEFVNRVAKLSKENNILYLKNDKGIKEFLWRQ